MDRSIRDIAWLAGWLEGEGSFGLYARGPIIQLATTDLDVLQRATRILVDREPKIYTDLRLNTGFASNKAYHKSAIHGKNAIGWMLTLYPLLGERRRSKIRKIVAEWQMLPGRRGQRNWKVTATQKAEIIALRKEGYSLCKLCDLYSISKSHILRITQVQRG